MERCAFCGWNRKNAFGNIRFFGIPKEPGMKRIQWLYVLDRKNVNLKEKVKVCSVHFRSGRPSSDPSHEDFVPHLYVDAPPLPEELDHIENLHKNNGKNNSSLVPKLNNSEENGTSRAGPSPSRKNSNKQPPNKKIKLENGTECNVENGEEDDSNSIVNNTSMEDGDNHNLRESNSHEIKNNLTANSSDITSPIPIINGSVIRNQRRIKVQHVPKHVVEAANLQPGVSVILRKYIRQ
uniref:THAP-type domain-containing protein n=1 Tax=Parastrongyloides trichosuri TaxID=131310 RepID=A0A0N4ZJ92_PARTI